MFFHNEYTNSILSETLIAQFPNNTMFITYQEVLSIFEKHNIKIKIIKDQYAFDEYQELINEGLVDRLEKQSIPLIGFYDIQSLLIKSQNKEKDLKIDIEIDHIMIFRNRLKDGFYLNPIQCANVIDNQKQFYNKRDIFDFFMVSLIQKKQEQHNLQLQAMKGRPTKTFTQSYYTPQLQQDQFYYRDTPSLQNGLQEYLNAPKQPKEYFGYQLWETLSDRFGWNSSQLIKLSEHKDICSILDNDKNFIRSAAISLFHFDFNRSCKSLSYIENPDIEIQIIRSAISSLAQMDLQPYKAKFQGNQLDAQLIFQQKIVEFNLQTTIGFLKQHQFLRPYVELMAKFIIKEGFQQYLISNLTDGISIFDKVELWIRFLSPEQIKLLKLPKGLDEIILYGKCEKSYFALLNYIDTTNDIQLAGIVSAYMYILDYPFDVLQIFYQYLELLEWLSEDFAKCQILAEIQLLDPTKQLSQPSKLSLGCNFCKKNLGQASLEASKKTNTRRGPQQNNDAQRTIQCPICGALFSKCVICTSHFSVPNLTQRRGLPQQRQRDQIQLPLPFVWCVTCKHGGHQEHINDWFSKYKKCAVSDCKCECASI
ncbi:hypothetical protein pb186bvf_007971 [Paramecium bursaria]